MNESSGLRGSGGGYPHPKINSELPYSFDNEKVMQLRDYRNPASGGLQNDQFLEIKR